MVKHMTLNLCDILSSALRMTQVIRLTISNMTDVSVEGFSPHISFESA